MSGEFHYNSPVYIPTQISDQSGNTITITGNANGDEITIRGANVGITILATTTGNLYFGNNVTTSNARIYCPNTSRLIFEAAGVEQFRIDAGTSTSTFTSSLTCAAPVSITSGGLTLPNGGTQLNYSQNTTLVTQFNSSGGTANIFSGNLTLNVHRIGNEVTLTLPTDAVNSIAFTAGNITSSAALLTQFRPAMNLSFVIRIRNGATITSGLLFINSTGIIQIFADVTGALFAGSANSGYYATSATWIV